MTYRAHECVIKGVEEKHSPLLGSDVVSQSNVDKLVVDDGLCLECRGLSSGLQVDVLRDFEGLGHHHGGGNEGNDEDVVHDDSKVLWTETAIRMKDATRKCNLESIVPPELALVSLILG